MMACATVLENKYGKISLFTKDSGKMTRYQVEVDLSVPKVTSMKALGRTENSMDKEFSHMLMVQHIQDSGSMIFNMDSELRNH